MHRWKFTALAAAAFASVALTTSSAHALTLGRMSVQSSLGQPLRAQIDIAQATPAELDALQVDMASPEQFRAHGMDFSSSAQAVRVTVQRRSDGTPYLSLSSTEPIRDPFVDLVLNTEWNSGSALRSYTLLLDPPASEAPVQVAQAPEVPAPSAAEVGRTYNSSGTIIEPPQAEAPAQPADAAPAAAAAPAAGANRANVRVRRGDTAGRLAQNNRQQGVSLDQMLVAMLRQNPNAFINGNVNRMRSGVVMQMPTREQALSTSASEARQIMAAQSRDFNAFRRSLATRTPRVAVAADERTATGRVQAQVADNAPQAAPDKLTLSKGAVQAKTQADEQLARDKQAAAQDSRMQELQRNMSELQNLTTPAAPAGAAPSTTAPEAQAGGVAVTSATLAAAAAGAETPATEPAATAVDNTHTTADTAATNEAAAEPPPPPQPATPDDSAAPAAPTPAQDTSAQGSSPWLPVGGALAALLLGLLGYGLWKRRQAKPTLSSFAQAAQAAAASPVREAAAEPAMPAHGTTLEQADAYLSYGQDAQAEATLHEVLRRNPQELQAWVKLCELHAKHHDLVQLEVAARSLLGASKGEGEQWEYVLDLGRQMDPRNPFYAVVQPTTAAAAPAAPAPGSFADALRAAPAAAAAAAPQPATPRGLDDMDLGFDLPNLDMPQDTSSLSAASVETWSAAGNARNAPSSDFDLDLDGLDLGGQSPSPARHSTPPTLDELHFDTAPPAPTVEPSASARVAAANTPLPSTSAASRAAAAAPSVDLGSLDLDMDLDAQMPAPDTFDANPVSEAELPRPTPPANEHLATKLDLAMEFNSIGDSEGARSLIEEVLAEADGPLKRRAQQLLSQLS